MEQRVSLAIVGSRNMSNQTVFNTAITEWIKTHGMPDQVVSGGARGADAMGAAWARKHGIPFVCFSPDWSKYGKAAGVIRNQDIVNECTHVLAFPAPQGKGTQDAIKRAERARKNVTIVSL